MANWGAHILSRAADSASADCRLEECLPSVTRFSRKARSGFDKIVSSWHLLLYVCIYVCMYEHTVGHKLQVFDLWLEEQGIRYSSKISC